MTGRRVAIGLVGVWLALAVVVLALDGLLLGYVAVAGPVSLVGLGVRAVWRQQRAPTYGGPRPMPPPLPERYRLADDPTVPLAVVVAAAEADAVTSPRP